MKLYLSTQEIDVALDSLIHQIVKSDKQYKYVVGIRNGGTHISPQVAEVLHLPHKSVLISYYGESHQPCVEPEIGDDFIWEPDGLIVDDLIDSGKTLDVFKSRFGPGDTAVIFWKEAYQPPPEYYVYKKPDCWITFPWEKQ
jgi:xanthine phosphoribosyltransferase